MQITSVIVLLLKLYMFATMQIVILCQYCCIYLLCALYFKVFLFQMKAFMLILMEKKLRMLYCSGGNCLLLSVGGAKSF